MRLACFTISSANYIARAQVLLRSLQEHCSGADLFFVLAEKDSVDCELGNNIDATVLKLDDLRLPNPQDMGFQYNITEFNTALKPFAIKRLFTDGYDAVIYLDPDICLYSSMDDMCELLEVYELLLTPHITKPLEEDGLFPNVQQCLQAGQFNLGFIGLRSSKQTCDFVDWWCRRLEKLCLQEPDYFYFVDQFWAAQAPSFVDETKVIRSSRYNVAYWNLHQRQLWLDKGTWMTEHGPLVFFHFSGYDFNMPNTLSRYTTRYDDVQKFPELSQMLAEYREITAEFKRNGSASLPDYSFGCYSNGQAISAKARRKFLALSDEQKKELGNPFERADFFENE